MNTNTFAGLGLNCERPSDNVAKVRTRMNAILEADPAYVSYEQVRDPDDRRRVHSIVITRCRGALRQQRLRAAQLARRRGRGAVRLSRSARLKRRCAAPGPGGALAQHIAKLRP